tara:strand:- start:449 stop:1549 length:1101 start_codon:yes stop_codon:yes gene_type:complete
MKNKKNKPYIMIAAGGSGGHLFSADAISKELKKRNYRIILLTDKRVKRFLDNFKADKIIFVPSDTFTNKGFIRWPMVAFKLLLGFFISLFWIILTRPILSMGFGGYPSLSPLLASKLLGRKIIIHEQNTVFGRANSFLSFFADGVSSGFKNTSIKMNKNINNQKIFGNPVREEIIKYKDEKKIFDERDISILIFGGSHGASFLTELVAESLSYLPSEIVQNLNITQQCRKEDINFLKDYFINNNVRHNVSDFFYDLPNLINQSDIIISRAGASTLSEMAICGKPCIFIPLPNTLDGDQEYNARNFELSNAAIVCNQNNLNPQSLSNKILELINDSKKREKLSKNIKSLGMPYASSNIADFAEEIIG